MEIGRIEGATRNLGAPAGWDPATDGHCGLRLSRDHNAALNIRERGRQMLLSEAA
jgi:hypothetical protein